MFGLLHCPLFPSLRWSTRRLQRVWRKFPVFRSTIEKYDRKKTTNDRGNYNLCQRISPSPWSARMFANQPIFIFFHTAYDVFQGWNTPLWRRHYYFGLQLKGTFPLFLTVWMWARPQLLPSYRFSILRPNLRFLASTWLGHASLLSLSDIGYLPHPKQS